MKVPNKILKAINKGVNLALDSFEDDTDLQQQTHGKVKDMQYSTIESLYLVDLGLPSGTLWCKYNLGVNISYLDYSHYWYGKRFAWGETSYKKIYNWITYKHCNKSPTLLTKYCPRGEKYNWVWDWSDDNVKRIPPDGKTKLELSDDAANVINEHWKIPSEKDFEELLEYTTGKQIKDYNNIIGLNGWEFTSKINSEKIFFPMTLQSNQLREWYWTNEIYRKTPYEAKTFYIDDFVEPRVNSTNRCFDLPIRPIYKK